VLTLEEDDEGGDRSSPVKSWKAARSLTQSLEEEEEEEELCAVAQARKSVVSATIIVFMFAV